MFKAGSGINVILPVGLKNGVDNVPSVGHVLSFGLTHYEHRQGYWHCTVLASVPDIGFVP